MDVELTEDNGRVWVGRVENRERIGGERRSKDQEKGKFAPTACTAEFLLMDDANCKRRLCLGLHDFQLLLKFTCFVIILK